jgi:hypothetical protein
LNNPSHLVPTNISPFYKVVSPFQAILDYEKEHAIPIGYINFAIQKGPPDTGAWQLLERGEAVLDDAWFAAFKQQLSVPKHWREFHARNSTQHAKKTGAVPEVAVEGEGDIPSIPAINAKKLFWNMMRISRTPDPYMYPALRRLRASGRFILAALSNTVAFPTGILDDQGVLFERSLRHAPHPNPYANDSVNIEDAFDVFVSSAHAGVRKPEKEAYELAVKEIERVWREKGGGGEGMVEAGDVLFLDDIGVNLKGARGCGLRTIKVNLGRTREAVRELEDATGVKLLGGEDKAKL